MKPTTWYKAMKRLESWGQIRLFSDKRRTLVSVLNWETYQQEEEAPVTTQGQPGDNPVTTQGQPGDTNKHRRTRTQKKFICPSITEVGAYCIERGNEVDPQRFHDHYTSNGWMVGKNKMKDWKAAVRTWEKSSPTQQSRLATAEEDAAWTP